MINPPKGEEDSMKVAQHEVLGCDVKNDPSRPGRSMGACAGEAAYERGAKTLRSSLPGRTRFVTLPSNKLLGYFQRVPSSFAPQIEERRWSPGYGGQAGTDFFKPCQTQCLSHSGVGEGDAPPGIFMVWPICSFFAS
jgi:hypothetical protein